MNLGDSRFHPVDLRDFFAGLTESTFQTQLGVADTSLVDYLSGLLLRFVRNDSLHRIRDVRGRPLVEVANMFAEADQRLGEARREILRHIGDFALFWAGVYPESLRASDSHGDRYGEFCEHGRRSYLIAATIEEAETEEAPSSVLERLGIQFEMCAFGLREVRRQGESPDDGPIRPYIIN